MTDTILPAYAAVLESVTRSTPPGGDPSEHLRVAAWILCEMTDTFLMLAFATACDACDEVKMPHPEKPGPGGNFADHPEPTPEVLTEAQAAAVKLYAAILEAPGGYDPAPAVARWWRGTKEDASDGHDVSRYWLARYRVGLEAAARCWGHYAVMSAIGHGVSWEDDNEPLKGPRYVVEGSEVWDITSRREGPMGTWAHEPARAHDFARMWSEQAGEAEYPSVRDLRVRADDITWSDAHTDAAWEKQDATAEYHARVADVDTARDEEERDAARAEAHARRNGEE